MTKKLLMGNEAFAHAALEAGVTVVAGYPGTPSSELIETVAKRVQAGAAENVHVEWSTNEKAALELLAGASYAGARTLFTCKQVGLNVASDPLMSLNYVGVEGGCVIYVADDPGPISSQTEQDTRRFASFAKIPVFDPSSVEQGVEMLPRAFALSERYRTPVIMRPTTRVCHSSTFVDVAEKTQGAPVKGFAKDDSRWVIFPARAYRGHKEINSRLAKIADEFSGACASETPSGLASEDLSRFNPIENHGDAPKIGIACGGVSTAYAKEALSILEHAARQATSAAGVAGGEALPSYRFMQIGTPFPFPEVRVDEFLDGLDAVIVFEELDSVIEDGLVHVAGLRAARGKSAPRVLGRASGACRDAGENDADDIAERLSKFFDEALLRREGVSGDELMHEIEERANARRPISISSFPHAHRCCAQAAPIVVRFTHASKRSRKCAFAVSFRAISAVTPWAMPSRSMLWIPVCVWARASRWRKASALSILRRKSSLSWAIRRFLRAASRALPMPYTTNTTSRCACSTIPPRP